MKKNIILTLFIVSLFAISCEQEETTPQNGINHNQDIEVGYIHNMSVDGTMKIICKNGFKTISTTYIDSIFLVLNSDITQQDLDMCKSSIIENDNKKLVEISDSILVNDSEYEYFRQYVLLMDSIINQYDYNDTNNFDNTIQELHSLSNVIEQDLLLSEDKKALSLATIDVSVNSLEYWQNLPDEKMYNVAEAHANDIRQFFKLQQDAENAGIDPTYTYQQNARLAGYCSLATYLNLDLHIITRP